MDGGSQMGYTPAFDLLEMSETVLAGRPAARTTGAHRQEHTLLRFGGLVMDPRTGATSWSGTVLALPVEERETLSVLLRRAGQIVSRERLASALDIKLEHVDRRVERLREALRAAGSTCLPYVVEGLGYILWRG
jgi:DNA-binding response OmpR family regulator